MRTTPLVGEKVWFGPHRIGWGLGPASAEGWAVTAATIAADSWIGRQWPGRRALRLLPGVGLVAIAVAKGTSPGGHRAWRAFKASKSAAGHR